MAGIPVSSPEERFAKVFASATLVFFFGWLTYENLIALIDFSVVLRGNLAAVVIVVFSFIGGFGSIYRITESPRWCSWLFFCLGSLVAAGMFVPLLDGVARWVDLVFSVALLLVAATQVLRALRAGFFNS